MCLHSPHSVPSSEYINKRIKTYGLYLQGAYNISEPPSFLKQLSLCLSYISLPTIEACFLVLLGNWETRNLKMVIKGLLSLLFIRVKKNPLGVKLGKSVCTHLPYSSPQTCPPCLLTNRKCCLCPWKTNFCCGDCKVATESTKEQRKEAQNRRRAALFHVLRVFAALS